MCGATGDHKHYAVVVYHDGNDSADWPRRDHDHRQNPLSVLTKSRATGIAEEINTSATLSAQVVPF